MRETKVEKPRIFQGSRDMFLSLGLMLIIIFVVVGTTGLCSFNPGNPKQGKVTTVVDDATFLTMEAQQAGYTVRIPELPDGWTPNSAKRVTFDESAVNGSRTASAQAEGSSDSSAASAPVGASVGWVHDKNWIELVQTGVSAEIASEGWDSNARTATGSHTTTDSNGATVTWTIYTSADDSVRRLWIADHGDARWLITGIGGDSDFTVMAEAISTAAPVSANTPASSVGTNSISTSMGAHTTPTPASADETTSPSETAVATDNH